MAGTHAVASHEKRKRWTWFRDLYRAHKVLVTIGAVLLAVVTAVAGSSTYDFVVKPMAQKVIDAGKDSPVEIAVSNNGSRDAEHTQGGMAWASSDDVTLATGTGAAITPPDGASVVALARPVSNENFPYTAMTTVSFNLTGTQQDRVRITKIEAVIDHRDPPPSGTVMYQIPQGDTPNGRFAIDLNSQDLNAKSISDNNAVLTSNYVDDRTVSIHKDEDPLGFVARVSASDCDCQYHFKLTFSTGATTDVKDSGGKPFRLVTFGKSYKRAYTVEYDEHSTLGVYECQFEPSRV